MSNEQPQRNQAGGPHRGGCQLDARCALYAEALLNGAVKHNEADEVLEELRSLVEDVLKNKPELAALFTNKAIGRDHMDELLRKVFLGRVSDTLGNFLLVLNEHDRLELLRPILQAYKDLNNERTRRHDRAGAVGGRHCWTTSASG